MSVVKKYDLAPCFHKKLLAIGIPGTGSGLVPEGADGLGTGTPSMAQSYE